MYGYQRVKSFFAGTSRVARFPIRSPASKSDEQHEPRCDDENDVWDADAACAATEATGVGRESWKGPGIGLIQFMDGEPIDSSGRIGPATDFACRFE